MLIVLDSTTRKLQAKMAMAAMSTNCSVTVAYADTTATTFVEGIYPSSLNGTTMVDILPAPAASTRRVIKSIILFNDDTDTHTVTLYLDDNGTDYPITKVTLGPGASWASDDQTGVNVGGAITDGSKGDINVSGGGSTWTIADDAVTLGKMAPLATDRLIGRDTAETDNPEAISVTGGIEFTGSQSIQVSAFSGDVSKPAGSTTTTITAGAVSTIKLGGDITTQGKALLDDATAADQRTTLGLGTIATQAANNVSISGGSITGITDLAVADGGTGASTASGARSNLLPSYTSNGGKVLAVNTGATDVEWITASGGDALTNENISPTTANPTVTVNKRYFATIAGLTANRDFVLPTPAVGNQIELSIVDGDDTYALIIKGASGVTINGGSAATEWSRLFIKGEVVRFVANTTSNWQVVTDGRIPSLCRLGRTSVQTFTTGTITNVAINSVTFDNGSLAKTSYSTTLFGTADAIVPRRTNKYIVTAGFRLTTLTAASNRVAAWFVDDNNVIWQFCELTAGNASAPGLALVTTAELTAGVALILRAAQYSGADQNTSSVPYPHLAITEVLS